MLSNMDTKSYSLVYQIEENFYYTITNFMILIAHFNPSDYAIQNIQFIKNNFELNNFINQISESNELQEHKLKNHQPLIDENYKDMLNFNLNMINLIIFAYQRRNKVQMISEYYIEKYLKDVLEILTSKNFNLGIKSDFLLATVTFISYFDGYENILFQNGLFHSILSDLTSLKLEKSSLEILSFQESIDQDFFNTILQFLYKTQSFKEIPIHFLNKVLEIPKKGIYPYRIDNVIFSLRKKRTLDENTLNELVIPRLIYEMDNFWDEDQNLFYYEYVYHRINSTNIDIGNLNLQEEFENNKFTEENKLSKFTNEQLELFQINLLNKDNKDRVHSKVCIENIKRTPTLFERSNLIIKLFKIIFSIFRHNTNASSLSYYENKMTETINKFFTKSFEMLNNEHNCLEKYPQQKFYYESIMLACMDLIDLICNYLPSAISALIESKIFLNLFDYLKLRTPKEQNVLNLIFKIFYSISLNEDGNKYLLEKGNEIITTLFSSFINDDYIISNSFSMNNFYTDDFFTPFSLFLRINNGVEIAKFFFENLQKLMKDLTNKLNNILEDKDPEIKLDLFLNNKIERSPNDMSKFSTFHKIFKNTPINYYNYKFHYVVNLISNFLINISQEEKDLLTKNNLVDIEQIFLDYYTLIFNPLMLLSISINILSMSILKLIFNKKPEMFINHITNLLIKDLKILNIPDDKFSENLKNKDNLFSLTNENNNKMDIEEIIDENKKNSIIKIQEDYNIYKYFNESIRDSQKDKIISKLVHFVEYSLRKMYNLSKEKKTFNKIISLNTTIMQRTA